MEPRSLLPTAVIVGRTVLAQLMSAATSYYAEYSFEDLQNRYDAPDGAIGAIHAARMARLNRLADEIESGQRVELTADDWHGLAGE